jgi:microcystin-dependent protein
MGTPYLAEIRIVAFEYAPKGWAMCNGQLLPINQNQALFSLLGTQFGGDGRVNFALPNLQGRTAMGPSGTHLIGQLAGEETHTLTAAEMPGHTHPAKAGSGTATAASPVGTTWASGGQQLLYAATPNTSMSALAIGLTGGGQPHENRPPFLTLNVVIALQGIFPSRN